MVANGPQPAMLVPVCASQPIRQPLSSNAACRRSMSHAQGVVLLSSRPSHPRLDCKTKHRLKSLHTHTCGHT